MWIVYGLLGFIGLYLLYRLVQFWQMWEQLKSEGRDIHEEMERIAARQWKEMKDGS